MKTRHWNLIVALTFGAGIAIAAPMGTAFTYQGRLTSGTNVANGIYDLRFTLHDAAGGGIQVAGPLTNAAIAVSNGLFTTSLNFGAGVFLGESRWLELSVRTNGNGAFTALTPRQALTPSPYALYAPSAGAAVTATSANGVASGAVGILGLQNNAVDSLKIADGTINGSDLSPTLLNSTFWKLIGNGGTAPGVNFLGTTDNQALELKVNSSRVLRLEPTASGSPNIIGGVPGNAVAAGTVGATISGGGAGGGVASNSIASDFATIGGGSGNSIGAEARFGTIGGGHMNLLLPPSSFFSGLNSVINGGSSNTIFARDSVIGGGVRNSVNEYAEGATISGGTANIIDAVFATIAGGPGNRINESSSGVSGSVIGGGVRNYIDQIFCTIAGGSSNAISIGYMIGSTIGGGSQNYMSESSWSVIAGGDNNWFQNSSLSVIGGGRGNHMSDSSRSVIAGGTANQIWSAGSEVGGNAAIGGGASNAVYAVLATVGGGEFNTIRTFAPYATVGGGSQNELQSAPYGTISGGFANTNQGDYSVIGGGARNSVNAEGATISGGTTNTIEGNLATISGGSQNSALGAHGAIGGGLMNYIANSQDNCTISGGSTNLIHVGQTSSSTIGGGSLNQIGQSSYSAISGGYKNQMLDSGGSFIGGGLGNDIDDSGRSVIAGGEDNWIFAYNPFRSCSSIGGGFSNQVDRPFATIPGGKEARAYSYGQMAYAAGAFASLGDAQTSVYVCRVLTTNATQTELFLDGSAARMDLKPNTTWTYDILITGRTSAGSSVGYQIRGVIENNSGTTALVGPLTKTVLAEDVAAWDATVTADDTNDALVISVTGAAATTIRWAATARTVEVGY